MAKGNKKGVVLPDAEVKAKDALEKFNKAHEGKTLTDAQKKQRAELRAAVGALSFVRIANKRVPKALKGIEAIANLSGRQYVRSEAQVKAICDALDAACKKLRNDLSGVKVTAGGFVLPTTDESKPE